MVRLAFTLTLLLAISSTNAASWFPNVMINGLDTAYSFVISPPDDLAQYQLWSVNSKRRGEDLVVVGNYYFDGNLATVIYFFLQSNIDFPVRIDTQSFIESGYRDMIFNFYHGSDTSTLNLFITISPSIITLTRSIDSTDWVITNNITSSTLKEWRLVESIDNLTGINQADFLVTSVDVSNSMRSWCFLRLNLSDFSFEQLTPSYWLPASFGDAKLWKSAPSEVISFSFDDGGFRSSWGYVSFGDVLVFINNGTISRSVQFVDCPILGGTIDPSSSYTVQIPGYLPLGFRISCMFCLDEGTNKTDCASIQFYNTVYASMSNLHGFYVATIRGSYNPSQFVTITHFPWSDYNFSSFYSMFNPSSADGFMIRDYSFFNQQYFLAFPRGATIPPGIATESDQTFYDMDADDNGLVSLSELTLYFTSTNMSRIGAVQNFLIEGVLINNNDPSMILTSITNSSYTDYSGKLTLSGMLIYQSETGALDAALDCYPSSNGDYYFNIDSIISFQSNFISFHFS